MGGSSGGSSGAVSYPTYMETKHGTWLDEVEALITAGVSTANPYVSASAYDPDAGLADSSTKLAAFNSVVTAFDPDSDWSTLWGVAQSKLESDVFSDALVNDKVAAYSASVLARLNDSVLPGFQRGMQNVRAVMTSAFTMGEATLRADAQRDIDKYEADLKRDNELKKTELISHGADQMLNALVQQMDYKKAVATVGIEHNRIKIVAKHEETERNLKYDEKDALWDLELYQYGGNMMASIAGAAAATPGKEVSTAQSVLGGAMSGAAMGAAIGPVGSLGGAAVAGIGGLLGGLGGLL